jgi:hypothetical protein
MALYYDLNVFKDVYKLILMVFEVTKDFITTFRLNLRQFFNKVITKGIPLG